MYSLFARREDTDSSSIVQLPGLRQKEQAGIQQSHRSSSLSLATYNPQRIDCQNSLRHMPSIMAISEPDAGSGSPKKLVCRTCNKASTTKYDPIILCPSCRRPYHDSCRAPPLRDGLDPYAFDIGACIHYLIELGIPGNAGSASETVTNAFHQR
jgi:uncharacterized CHY-type Zn-finger protein